MALIALPSIALHAFERGLLHPKVILSMSDLARLGVTLRLGGRKRGARFVIYNTGCKGGLIGIQQSEAAEQGNLQREVPRA